MEKIFKQWKDELAKFAPGIPIVLAGNKLDLLEDKDTLQHLKKRNQAPVTAKQVKKRRFVCPFNRGEVEIRAQEIN